MELLIVSGLSGSGKSVSMNALEDIGYFCMDNIPAKLLSQIAAFARAGDNQLDEVLCRRYKETRRRHPISLAENIPTIQAITKEREILQPLLDRADYVMDTSLFSTAQNKERICDLFIPGGGAKAAMRLNVVSFGFKFGLPGEADLVLDVRCLPNPFYVPQLKHKTGMDQEVVDYVMSFDASRELLKRIEYLLEYALPLYVKEGKSELTIGVGCTGGKHRSITFARKIAAYCEQQGYAVSLQHRDASR